MSTDKVIGLTADCKRLQMRTQTNWNAVTAVCAIVLAVFTASGWLTDGLREDIRDLRQEMREGFAETRVEIEALQQDVAYIKAQIRADQTLNGNAQRPASGK